ncbi:MAG: ABC transporter substrate-binding protein [Chitinispirillales bacterium]|nr:ABC transporter substrate-binding protein [Chitinispirillales bacterium]
MRLLRLVLIALTLFMSCGKSKPETTFSVAATPQPVTRIVSFAPSITEILYELGLGDRVCGVTQFCKYPPEAAQKEKIGWQAGNNYEAVVRLRPDLAVILKEQRGMTAFFDQYNIRYIAVGSDSVDEILESIQSIADACSVAVKGKTVVEDLRRRISPMLKDSGLLRYARNDGHCEERSDEAIQGFDFNDSCINKDSPRVLLCVSRDEIGTGAIGKSFVAGANSFYDQLISAAGGVNAMGGVKQEYPAITAEAVIRLAPDVIIELSMSYADKQQERKNCDDWKALKTVPAVKTGRIYCLSGDYLTIPGPRIALILEDFKDVLHKR